MNRFALVLLCIIAACIPAIAQVGLPWPGPGGPASGGGGGSSTAWTSAAGSNNFDTNVTMTTTSGDTVTSNSATTNLGNRSNNTAYGGSTKVFVLFQVLTGAGGFQYVGLCSTSTALNSSGVFCGASDANGATLELVNAVLRNNNNTNAHQFNGGTQIGSGYAIEMAFDIGGGLMWARTSANGGSTWGAAGVCTGGPCWNDSNSGQTPGVSGGLSITATGPFLLYYADNSSTTGKVQLDCSSAAYTSDKPSGFSTC